MQSERCDFSACYFGLPTRYSSDIPGIVLLINHFSLVLVNTKKAVSTDQSRHKDDGWMIKIIFPTVSDSVDVTRLDFFEATYAH